MAYVRRAASVNTALPWLYFRSISKADIGLALQALIGLGAGNPPSGVISRFKKSWAAEYAAWNKSDLSKERWVYMWANGGYSSMRAEDHRLCALVVAGVDGLGKKLFLALAFYGFPAEYWIYLRTSIVIESTSATIRHRTRRGKGVFSGMSLLAMLFKLAICAERSLRRLKEFAWLAEVIRGVKFVDGICEHQ